MKEWTTWHGCEKNTHTWSSCWVIIWVCRIWTCWTEVVKKWRKNLLKKHTANEIERVQERKDWKSAKKANRWADPNRRTSAMTATDAMTTTTTAETAATAATPRTATTQPNDYHYCCCFFIVIVRIPWIFTRYWSAFQQIYTFLYTHRERERDNHPFRSIPFRRSNQSVSQPASQPVSQSRTLHWIYVVWIIKIYVRLWQIVCKSWIFVFQHFDTFYSCVQSHIHTTNTLTQRQRHRIHTLTLISSWHVIQLRKAHTPFHIQIIYIHSITFIQIPKN